THGGGHPAYRVAAVVVCTVCKPSGTSSSSTVSPSIRTDSRPSPTVSPRTSNRCQGNGRTGATRSVPAGTSGSIPSKAVRIAGADAAAQACGRQAGGYGVGTVSRFLPDPLYSSGSRYPNASAASISPFTYGIATSA